MINKKTNYKIRRHIYNIQNDCNKREVLNLTIEELRGILK